MNKEVIKEYRLFVREEEQLIYSSPFRKAIINPMDKRYLKYKIIELALKELAYHEQDLQALEALKNQQAIYEKDAETHPKENIRLISGQSAAILSEVIENLES